MLHADLDGEAAGGRPSGLFSNLVRSGRGVVGMDQFEPGIVTVLEFVLGVAQLPFPRGRVKDPARFEIEIKETDRAVGGQQAGG